VSNLAGYIATLCVGIIGTYLSQFLRPKVKIKYWFSHSFTYTIPKNQINPAPNPAPALAPAPGAGVALAPAPSPNFFLLTQSLTVQNFGRERAEWIEIVHRQKPDFFQLFPSLNFTVNTTATGEHTLRVQSLAPKEFFTIQFLSYTHNPELLLIRSTAGHATLMPWMTVTKYPRWVYSLLRLLLIVGASFCAFWTIKGVIFILKSVGAL
jgi:hypothetical protein